MKSLHLGGSQLLFILGMTNTSLVNVETYANTIQMWTMEP